MKHLTSVLFLLAVAPACAVDASSTASDAVCEGGKCDDPNTVAPLMATAISAGGRHTCALTTDGNVRCWGDNTGRQTGDDTQPFGDGQHGPISVAKLPGPMSMLTLRNTSSCGYVAAANLPSVLLERDDGAVPRAPISPHSGVYCWGGSTEAFLPTGEALTNRQHQGAPKLLWIDGMDRFEETATQDRAPALTSMAFGMGQLCVANNAGVSCHGVRVDGSTGSWWLAALSEQKQIQVCNDSGSVCEPAYVPAIEIAQLVGSKTNVCALATDGRVWCWGYNGADQLGAGVIATNEPVPVALPNGEPATSISVGDENICIVSASGVYCRGDNSGGALGTGSTLAPLRDFTKLDLPAPPTKIVQSDAHACGIVGGDVYCWRRSFTNVTGLPVRAPSKIEGIAGEITDIAVGDFHACVLTDRGVQCWGDGRDGANETGSEYRRAGEVRFVPARAGD